MQNEPTRPQNAAARPTEPAIVTTGSIGFVPLPPAPSEAPSAPPAARSGRPQTGHSWGKIAYRLGSFLVAMVVLYYIWPTGLGGSAVLTTTEGQSMEPTYFEGDFVVLRETGDYVPGDIVGFIVPAGEPNGGTRVLHRIIGERTDGSYELLGDGNLVPDPWHITDDDILGEAVLHIPGGGKILTSRWTIVVVILVVMARVAYFRLARTSRAAEDELHGSSRHP